MITRRDDGCSDEFSLQDDDLYGDESYEMDEDGYVYKNGVPGQMSVTSTVFDHTVLETSHILIKDNKVEIRSEGDIEVQSGGTLTLKGEAALNVESEGNIHLSAGGTFTTESQNFTVDSEGNVAITGNITATGGDIAGWQITDGYLASGSGSNHVRLSTNDPTYAIWAGAEEGSSAPYRVSKDGTVYLTKLYVTDENGVAQTNPVDLRTNYWKLDSAYAHAVASMSADSNGLHITLNNGDHVDFKKATTATIVQKWSGGRL